jgi:sugar fermentation stimulation protein A
MKFSPALHEARLIRRYKRFLADVELADGSTTTAHCANSGSMLGLNVPGAQVWLSHHDTPTRKLAYGWELLRLGDAYIGVNTGATNRLVAEAVAEGRIPELAGYSIVEREVAVGASRLDFRLRAHENDPRPCYMEVKSVTLRRGGPAEFPDAVTTRGTRHLGELAVLAKTEHRAVMLYVVQRTDCASFRLAADIDPAYAAAFTHAVDAGIEVLCYDCQIDAEGIALNRPIPIET